MLGSASLDFESVSLASLDEFLDLSSFRLEPPPDFLEGQLVVAGFDD